MLNKKGQVWVETVIYTLIGLTLIGVVLSLGLPKINAYKDKVIVEQSIEAMNSLDAKIKETIDSSAGNVRKVDFFSIKRGEMFIDGSSEQIRFVVNGLKKPYSEPGAIIDIGSTRVGTQKNQADYSVFIVLDYSLTANLSVDGANSVQKYSESSTPYAFSIENKGVSGGKVTIDIRETSGR